jgi:hypothetical protein
VLQQAEVQEVTFSAGAGVGGEATLTYTDLYGQDWTTRPFAVGGETHYVLEYALATGFTNTQVDLVLSYGGVAQYIDISALGDLTAAKIREKLLAISTIYVPAAGTRANKGREVFVTERPHATSIKLNGAIEHSTRKIFDIYMTPDPRTGYDENGGLLEFKSYFGTDNTTEVNAMVTADLAYTAIHSTGDHSDDIRTALESLPNQVIPSVTVTKAAITSPNTAVLGAHGNAFKQTYRITFNAPSNSGDQHMLACDATACDHDGCANRKLGVSDVKYIHYSDAQNAWKKINFQGAGYFVMSIHSTEDNGKTALTGDFSAGMGYLKWNTGEKVETADFALIGNAAAVQTALRTITGWEAVTVVELTDGDNDGDFTAPHAFTVTFPAGYDDGGQVPVTGAYASSVYTRGGTKATTATVSVVDQRFSNSLWIGEISGWHKFSVSSDTYTGADSKPTAEGGDVFEFSSIQYGFDTAATTSATAITGNCVAKSSTASIECTSGTVQNGKVYGRIQYSANRPTQTSQQTEDYFAVGANVEVMDLTWADGAIGTDVTGTSIKNTYRKFGVLSHVTNGHGKMFAKLDSTPETDSSTDYTLRVTSNNGTTSSFKQVRIVASQNEVQTIKVVDGSNILGHTATQTYRIYINKGKSNEEFTEVLTYGSSNAQVAEAINAFSALSGPVKVDNTLHGFDTGTGTTHAKVITFDAIDGDVPQLRAESVGTLTGTLHTTTIRDGSSLTGGADARFEHMEAGGMINITSQETVTFTLPSSGTSAVIAFSYDNVMQSGTGVLLSGNISDGGTIDAALASIQDDNLVQIIGTTSDIVSTFTAGTDTIVVTLPKGLSGAKLEVHVLAGAVNTKTTKTVNRNNNGKSFTIVRAAHTKIALPNLGNHTTNDVKMSNELVDLRVGDVLDVTGCTGGGTAPNGGVTPFTVPITAFSAAQGAVTITAAFGGASYAGCVYSQVRDTLVLDAIPDAMTGLVDVTYTAPRGSCAVTEVSKGTTESATCSHRGVCDGGSGLCVCHEGYSGEACETQTVLV